MAGQSKRELKRQHIVASAQAVAAREGSGAATLRAIAAEAGMAPNAVLYYFGSLADIAAAAVQSSSDRLLQQLNEAVASHSTPTAKLAAAIRSGTMAGLNDDISRILYEYWPDALRDDEMRRIQAELTREQQSIYQDIIAMGVASGDFRAAMEPADIARILVAQEDGLVMDVLAGVASSRYVLELNARLAAVLLDADPAQLV
ncbi:TetR/AcrR family transcriptional regulator [Arthrobacter sp. CJ23]|uniref:TetR/AcrR family transcriptional regulator n=1 Tax=Arthrobacter sp. CJ23 TaxID=2972479 RepID=UPI00215C41AF|nr:TetR family transcriptional regulator C-terminal domain-containing protein [Arthrobacter sp. CJ23]UVJ38971.1 TetR family transcriptional regulator C-terminal domain-containing protein [Arthrobacter sp. CJ23]